MAIIINATEQKPAGICFTCARQKKPFITFRIHKLISASLKNEKRKTYQRIIKPAEVPTILKEGNLVKSKILFHSHDFVTHKCYENRHVISIRKRPFSKKIIGNFPPASVPIYTW